MMLRIPDKCPSVYEDHDRQVTLPENACCSKVLQALSTGTNRQYSSRMVIICQIISGFYEGGDTICSWKLEVETHSI